LYAGAGLFSLPLMSVTSQITAVEGDTAASRYLRRNLQRQLEAQGEGHLGGDVRGHLLRSRGADVKADVVPTGVARALRLNLCGTRPGTVVLDPPRAGAGPNVTSALTDLHPELIIYVSCDGATLARDLSVLVGAGYQMVRVEAYDLFPGTHHLETVTVLQSAKS
jgi:tRNA/tmRNA/rRNA uracil-C5-methylase (TrmA/RlmC/RlmD family)